MKIFVVFGLLFLLSAALAEPMQEDDSSSPADINDVSNNNNDYDEESDVDTDADDDDETLAAANAALSDEDDNSTENSTEEDAEETDEDEATSQELRRDSVQLERVLVEMKSVPKDILREFGAEVSSIKERLSSIAIKTKAKRDELGRKLAAVKKQIKGIKGRIKSLENRIRRMKRRADADAKKRAERLKKQLRSRIRAHRAGLNFVRKLAEQVKTLDESVKNDFGDKASNVQNLLQEYSEDLEMWTGVDVASEIEENKKIGTDTKKNRLYTKKHLNRIVNGMLSKLRSSYQRAKDALANAHKGYENPHVRRLQLELNGLKQKLSQLDAQAAKLAGGLANSGHLDRINAELKKIKDIENYIYTQRRVEFRVSPCVVRVKRCHVNYNRCRNNLRSAVSRGAPKKETYVLWKQYVDAKKELVNNVQGCSKKMEEEQQEDETI